MTILSYQTIKKYCQEYNMIDPFCEKTIFNGMSYGLGPASYDFRVAQQIEINAGMTVLCSTIEKVKIPNHIAARVCDKSTWARRGIVVQNTHFDPGFEGYPTIEVSFHPTWSIFSPMQTAKIEKGMPICQFIFEFLDQPTEMPYKGKYQNQPSEPVEAKYEE